MHIYSKGSQLFRKAFNYLVDINLPYYTQHKLNEICVFRSSKEALQRLTCVRNFKSKSLQHWIASNNRFVVLCNCLIHRIKGTHKFWSFQSIFIKQKTVHLNNVYFIHYTKIYQTCMVRSVLIILICRYIYKIEM